MLEEIIVALTLLKREGYIPLSLSDSFFLLLLILLMYASLFFTLPILNYDFQCNGDRWAVVGGRFYLCLVGLFS